VVSSGLSISKYLNEASNAASLSLLLLKCSSSFFSSPSDERDSLLELSDDSLLPLYVSGRDEVCFQQQPEDPKEGHQNGSQLILIGRHIEYGSVMMLFRVTM